MEARWCEPSWSRLLAATLVAIGVGSSDPARADQRIEKEAERRNRVATALYNEGRYDSALQMYQSAYDLFPAPKFLFNIGLAKEKTFDYEGCALAFRDFLRQSGTEGEATVREAAHTRLETCLQKTTIPVRFTSVPTNAAVYLGEGDRKELRGRTPQQLPLAQGKHLTTVELEGYVSQEQVIEVSVGTRPQADFVLEKLSSLRVEVDPAGARVALGGGDWQPAPVEQQVRAGVHRVRVEKAGYESAQREVKVESGQEVSLVLSLRPLPTIRKLTVAVAGAPDLAARVAIDGELLDRGVVDRGLGPGDHEIRVTAPGYLPYAADIPVPEDRDVRLVVTLGPRRSRRSRTILWSLAGAAGVAALIGSGYGLLALSDQATFDDDRSNLLVHQRGEQRAERADFGFGTAAALGASALGYYFLTPPHPSSGRIER